MHRRQLLCFLIAAIAAVFIFSTMPVLAKSTGGSSATTSAEKNSKSKKKTKKKKEKSKKSKSAGKKKLAEKKSSKKKTSKKTTKTAKRKTGKVNINTADAKTLTEFTGVGPVTARKIISYRKKHGKFKTAKDLMNVKGIGEKTMQKMKPQLKF